MEYGDNEGLCSEYKWGSLKLYYSYCLITESLDQLEWSKRYCILDKDERRLSFFNDTEVTNMAILRHYACVYDTYVYMHVRMTCCPLR